MGNGPNVYILQLNALAVIVLLTLAAVLFFRRNNAKANIFLGFLLLYPAISILLNVIFLIFKQHQYLFLAPMSIGCNLTFGPILLIYLHFIEGREDKSRFRRVVHFIPAIAVFASAIYYMLIPESEKAAQLADILAGENNYINLINLFLLLHICGYLYAAWKQVQRYARGAAELDMANVAKSVNWQKSLLGCICAINAALLLAFAVPVIITGSAHIYSDLIATPVAALLIYVFMMYKGLSYHVIYNRVEYEAFTEAAKPLNSFVAEVNSSQPLYKEELIADKKAALLHLFEEKKIFTTGTLKLHDVAEMLEISPAALSYIINKQLHMTFFEMVNKYRVEEAKQLFVCPDHQHYKIESIGKLSGFNSKASFYAVFKKLTGKTPQVFKEEQGLC